MDAMMQNCSGSTVESQEDDEVRIKSLSELRSLWEGMASKNDDRTLKSGGQRKPQLVRGDRSSKQTEETAELLTTSSLATVPGTMTTQTSSAATVTISLVTPPSNSTTKVKRSVTTPTSDMEHFPRFNATVPSSTTISAAIPTTKHQAIPMATHQAVPITTHQVVPMATHQAVPMATPQAIPMTTHQTIPMTTNAISRATAASSSITKPSSYTSSATSNSMTTTTSRSVAAITTSTPTSGDILRNGKINFRPHMTSHEPWKSDSRFESHAGEATGKDQKVRNKIGQSNDQAPPQNKAAPIKTPPTPPPPPPPPTDASRTSTEVTLTFLPSTGDGEDGSSSQHRVVRGSILVRNSIDMIGGWPSRLLDVVETSDSDEGIVVEENTNLFHGRYFQLRENPLYFSDHEDQEDEEVEGGGGREDGSKMRREKTKAGKYLRSGDGGSGGKMVSTVEMEKQRNTSLQDKDVTSSTDNHGSSSRPSSLPFSADRCVKVDGPNRSQILRLVDDGSDGARQTVTVDRTDEELTQEMMEALQVSGDPSKGVTNVEVVEERLDVELSNGLAHVKVTVHCERIIPNRMTGGQSYRKSSVTVTRMTEVDMLATPERRRIYERVVDRYGTPEEDVSYRSALVPRSKLSTDDVYALYRVFVEVTGQSRSSLEGDPGNQLMAHNLSKTEVAGLELLNGQSLPLSLLRLGPLISPVSLTQ